MESVASTVAASKDPSGVDLEDDRPSVSHPLDKQNAAQSTILPEFRTSRKTNDKVVVMGRMESEDTRWVSEELSDDSWDHAVYTVDNKTASLHTPANKGKEAMPHLSYLTDHYHDLPTTIAFVHSHRDGYPAAWHTDAEDYSNGNSLRSLNIDFVQRNGYANLRCIAIPGCPDEIQPFREPRDEARTAENNIVSVWPLLFNNTAVPDVIGAACCAQFAVSRDQVLKRPLEDYVRYRQWLLETELDDDVSGRIMEYLWHYIFGQDLVYCPALQRCYCDVYGKC
ncbi:hypothetical protein H2201_001494 [Coniosporium apollinis]|uniref:Uncharacterized protein n=1 Tax=Coniosporium apollinis TaxID=61459 RepID=A0ABQ9P1G7_9PEZI|nr:hypothetical protein H2201_001494 [Coniosporium apollinis]